MPSLAETQDIRFCTTPDGVRLAYAVSGTGPPLVKTAHWMSHIEYDWDSPVWRSWLAFLSAGRTLIRFDPRGCGLSERDVGEVSLAGWRTDLETVVSHAGLERYELLGMSQGGPVAIDHAVRHADRVEKLVFYGSYARGRDRRGLPETEKRVSEAMRQLILSGWGRENAAFRQIFTSLLLPGGAPEQIDWYNDLQRLSATPEMAVRMVEAMDVIDVTHLAGEIRTPTLVVHARGDARIPASEGRLLASLIPGARFVALDSANHVLLEDEPAWSTFTSVVADFLDLPAPTAAGGAPSDAALEDLTERERDVLALLAEGMTNKAIARELGLSPKTVRNYVSTVLSKLDVDTRTEAAAVALRADPGA